MGNTQTNHRASEKEDRDEALAFNKSGFDSFSVLNGHQGGVTCLVVVDGSTVATGSVDGEIILWDVEKRALRWRMQYTSLDDFDSDGDDVPHTRQKRVSSRVSSRVAHQPRGGISILLPLTDLNLLVSSSVRSSSTTIWSLATGEQLGVMSGKHKAPIVCVVAVPGYTHLLATAGADPFICLWTAAPAANSPGETPPTLGRGGGGTASNYFLDAINRTSSQEIVLLLALRNGRFASVQAQSNRVFVHRIPEHVERTSNTNQEQALPASHDNHAIISHLIGIQDRSEFVTGDDRGKVVIWSATSFSPVRTFTLSKLLKLNKILQMSEAGEKHQGHDPRSYSTYGNGVFGIEDDDLGWNAAPFEASGSKPHSNSTSHTTSFRVTCLDYNIKQAALAVGVGSHFVILPLPESREYKKCDSPDLLSKSLFAHKQPLTQIRWVNNVNGQFLLTSSEDNTIKTWDVCTREHRRIVLREAYHSAASSQFGGASSRMRSSLSGTDGGRVGPPPAAVPASSAGNSPSSGSSVSLLRPFSLLSLGSKRRRNNTTAGTAAVSPGRMSTPPGSFDINSRSSNNSADSTSPCMSRPSSSFFRPFRPSLNELLDPLCELEIHSGTVTCLSLIPSNPSAFLSASSDGRVVLWSVGASADMTTVEMLRKGVPAVLTEREKEKGGNANATNAEKVEKTEVQEASEEEESSEDECKAEYDAPSRRAYLKTDWMSAGCDIEFQRRNWLVSVSRDSAYNSGHPSDAQGSVGTQSPTSGLMNWSPLQGASQDGMTTSHSHTDIHNASRPAESPLFVGISTPRISPTEPGQRLSKVGSSSYVLGLSAFAPDDDNSSNCSPTAKASAEGSAEDQRHSNTSSGLTPAHYKDFKEELDEVMPVKRKGSNRMHSFTADQTEWAKFQHKLVGGVFPRSPPLDTCPPPPASSPLRGGLPLHGCTTPSRQMHTRGYSDRGYSDSMIGREYSGSGMMPSASSMGGDPMGTSISSTSHLRMAAKRTVSANRIPLVCSLPFGLNPHRQRSSAIPHGNYHAKTIGIKVTKQAYGHHR